MATNPNETYPYDIVHATRWSKGGKAERKTRLVVLKFNLPTGSTKYRYAVRWQTDRGEEPFKNPRNAAAGSLQFGTVLSDHFDLVGFDPRGVGASTAVDCLTDAELDAERSGADETPISSETSADAARTDVADYATWLRGKCDAATSTKRG